jgi:hypothetical protein
MNWSKNLAVATLAMIAANASYADIISQALSSLPAQTGYVEYENLASLRRLRNYARLRQRYSGNDLQELRIALGELGIRENQVNELVAASSPSAFYGLVAGTFSEQSLRNIAVQKGFAIQASDRRALCPGKGTCVLFLEASLAAFGSLSELKEIAKARQGSAARLASKSAVVTLLNNTDHQAPVRGVLIGPQLETEISDTLREWTGWNRDWSQISSNVRDVAYSVKFDDRAHFSATLQCKSAVSATLLLQTIRLLEGLQSIPLQAGNSDTAMTLRNLHASSSGSTVMFSADTLY